MLPSPPISTRTDILSPDTTLCRSLERHRRIPGPVGGARRREALIVQWDDIGPAALAGGDLRRQLVEDIELEDRADRELRVGMRRGEGGDGVVVERGDEKAGPARPPIGRARCRERGCQYVSMLVDAVS